MAAWGRLGDTFRFYEINPDVEALSRRWFTFLKDSGARSEIVLGDARVQLERELASGRSHDFDLIAVDAFSSDAIPLHLLTAECGDIYRQRLKPGGLLMLHISNRALNLEPVARGLAQHLGWQPILFVSGDDYNSGEHALAHQKLIYRQLRVSRAQRPGPSNLALEQSRAVAVDR